MSILFISDIHLCAKELKIANSFFYFLKNYAIHAKALYILGDLFEQWLGDDNCSSFHINIANALKNLTQKNVPCYFIHGNHDFLLGKKYANLCGMSLLPTIKVLKLSSGQKVVILHGDILCVNDISYQKFRQYLHCFKMKKFFLSLPISIRSYIFNKIHFYCTKYKKYKENNNINIDSKIAIEILIQNKAGIMVHGHTHQSAIYKIYNSKKNILNRITLGGWDKYGSVVEINEDNNHIILTEFPLNTTYNLNNIK